MAEASAVWRLDRSHHWGLYTHTDYKLPQIQDEDANAPKGKQKNKAAVDTPFYTSKVKQEIKGTTICTPKGYGIIQAIDTAKGTITVKVQGVIHEFDKTEATSEVPITVVYLKDSMKVEETVYVSVTSTMKEIFERVENSVASTDAIIDIKLFFQGKELDKSDETVEKLKITPFSKFLATYVPGKPLMVNRFTTNHSGWCVGGGGLDGIAFVATKNIRVIGFGIYPPTNHETLSGNAKLYQGDSTKALQLWTTDFSWTKNRDDPENKVFRILFDRPYTLKAGDYFSCVLSFTASGNTYYGSGGQNKSDGEGDVQFSFKNCEGAYNGTGPGSGQIPEIYYYI